MEDSCPFCKREMIHKNLHHLIPKSRGGTNVLMICSDCHKTIHCFFTNKELEKKYHTVEVLMNDERFAKAIKFLSKQDPHRRHRSKKTKRRGRSG